METHWKATIGGRPVKVKVLRTPNERALGYQHCEEPPIGGEGLLFIFDGEQPRSFHMRNVPFDLDLLGFDVGGRLICSIPMKSGGMKVYTTPPCKYVVEVPKGWATGLCPGKCNLKVRSV